jgi:hypothetical protein
MWKISVDPYLCVAVRRWLPIVFSSISDSVPISEINPLSGSADHFRRGSTDFHRAVPPISTERPKVLSDSIPIHRKNYLHPDPTHTT